MGVAILLVTHVVLTGLTTVDEAMEKAYRRNLFYQQLSLKLKQLAYIKDEARKTGSGDTSFSDVLVLVALVAVYVTDSLLGVLFVHCVRKVAVETLLANFVYAYTITFLEWAEWLLNWLMDAPGGLKLNAQMTEFLAVKCISLLGLWKYFYLTFIDFYLHYIITFVFFLQFAGLTVVLAITHDFMKFLNFYHICFYIFSSFLLRHQVSALKSLFRLFMGKKRNPLRNRIDSLDYDASRLLLGTLSFTILLFLLPTTAMFYLVFLMLRVTQFCFQLTIRVAIVLVNQLLVFATTKLVTLHNTASLSSAKITLAHFPDENSAEATVHWDGHKLSIPEFEHVLSTCSKEKLCADSEKSPCRSLPYDNHSMLKWIDTTPF